MGLRFRFFEAFGAKVLCCVVLCCMGDVGGGKVGGS